MNAITPRNSKTPKNKQRNQQVPLWAPLFISRPGNIPKRPRVWFCTKVMGLEYYNMWFNVLYICSDGGKYEAPANPIW
jgi:hypothetical protein